MIDLGKAAPAVGSIAVWLCCLAAPAWAQSPPAPWSSRDIGPSPLSGRVLVESGGLVIDAAGEGIGDRRDGFHFVYQAITGDVDVRARIEDLELAEDGSAAGLMIRGDLRPVAAHAAVLVTATDRTIFQRRAEGPGRSHGVEGSSAARWVRLVRTGTRVVAYTSRDGVAWKNVGSDEIDLEPTAYVGIAVTSRNPGVRTTVRVSDISVVATAPPAGQLTADIGDPPIKGSTSVAAGRYTVTAAGVGFTGDSDQLHFVYQPIAGDVEVIARVESIANTHRWATAGVMIRESLAPGSRHATLAASRAKGWSFRRRVDTNGLTDESDAGPGTPPGWVRLVRTGPLVEAFRSADGKVWTRIAADTIPMSDGVYVGIAVASHKPRHPVTAVVDHLKIKDTSPPPNRLPVVALTSPAAGRTLTAPAAVTLTASASDADGTITAVEFYSDSTLLSRDASAPHTFVVSGLQPGSYSFRAVAVDDRGATTLSAPVTVTVTVAPGVQPRIVSFTASVDHQTLVKSYLLEVYTSGATPGRATPVATLNLGKPAPDSNRDVTVDCSAFFGALAPGGYVATVTAIGSGGRSRSTAVSFTR